MSHIRFEMASVLNITHCLVALFTTEEEMDTKDVQDGVETQIGEKLAPFNPSNPAVISSALRMLQVGFLDKLVHSEYDPFNSR
jgi:hypothetical protein